MFEPIMNQERIQCFGMEKLSQCVDVEQANCNSKMCPYKQQQSSNCVNYYDNQFCVLEEIKKEFPEDECPQSSASCNNKCSINNKIVLENEELSKVLKTREIKQENSEETYSYIKIEEIHEKKNQFIAKAEVSEQDRLLNNAGDTSVLYEVLITPQEIKPEMCGGILKNRFNLSSQNNEHIKVEPPKLVGNEMNELHKCECCDEYFNNYDNMLAHVSDAHSNEKPKSESYHKGKKPHLTKRNGEKMEHKCDSCERVYKSKTALLSHTKRIHFDYGRMFECWCGEQFRSPMHLRDHKYRHHGVRIKNKNSDKFQCDSCHKVFKVKSRLVKHIKNVHYDYGKVFECWCGKQFRTPMHLRNHKYRHHGVRIKNKNNDKFQCISCNKIFKFKSRLVRHIQSVHYDYGKVFECWCGKKFRSPRYLYIHKMRQHGTTTENESNGQFQCDSCHKCFKTKLILIIHIKGVHYDYGKVFECWCGKEFRTPRYLYMHKRRQHGNRIKNKSCGQFQCDSCQKIFGNKLGLLRHIRGAHYDYGKVFECSCGKQFSTPLRLYQHNRRQHL